MKSRTQMPLFAVMAAAAFSLPAQPPAATGANLTVAMDDARIVLLGQIDTTDARRPRLGYPGTGMILRLEGGALSLRLSSTTDTSALTVVIDHGAPALKMLRKGEQTLVLASGLDPGPHVAEVYKRTETWQGVVTLTSIELSAGGSLLSPVSLPARKLLFVGDSVTCGAGVDNNPKCNEEPAHPISDSYHSFGMDLGRRLDAQTHLVCYGGRGLDRDYRGLGVAEGVLNAPQLIDLSIPSDDPGSRATWDYRRWTPDAIVVSLGTNDFNLEGIRPLSEEKFVTDYAHFLKSLRAEYPGAFILTTEGAIVTDPRLRRYVQEAVAQTADARIAWVPAEHYPGNGCNAHPDAPQHLHMADDLEPVLRRVLGW